MNKTVHKKEFRAMFKKIVFAILFAMASMAVPAQENTNTALLGAWSGKLLGLGVSKPESTTRRTISTC